MNDELKNYAGLPVKYIVAGNYNEYQAYVKRKPRIEHYYKYVAGTDTLRGLSSIDGFYIGSYKNRPDIDEIKAIIATIKTRQVWSDIKPAQYQWSGDSPSVGVIAQELGPDIATTINGGDVSDLVARIIRAKKLLEKEIDDYEQENGCE
jgi:hypothetical protein